MRIGPVVVAFIVCALFVTAADAEAPVHLLAAVWLSFAAAVLILAICRVALLGYITRPKYANGKANSLKTEYDEWGVALTASLIITGLVFLYLLD